MDDFEIGRLIYLVLLLLMVAGWFFTQNRQKMNKSLQQMVLWGFLFAGMILLYGLKDDLKLQIAPYQSVQQIDENRIALSRANDRHFYANMKINGQTIVFVVDTGATDIVLSQQDARKIGIDPNQLAYIGRARTANGEVRTARVKLDQVQLAGFTDRNVTAWVNDGDMAQSLLGMAYLSRFSRIEIAGDTLYLTR